MPAAETASALLDAALAAGGRDNVTVVVLDVLAGPDRRFDPQETQEVPPAAPDPGASSDSPPSGVNPG